jgi:dTDP-glucose 4,6-dehydratase
MSDYHLPVNIGNPQEITLKQLAEEIIQLTGSTSKITYHPLPVDDPKQRCPNITKAKDLLDWSPKVERLDGLAETLKYFRTVVK